MSNEHTPHIEEVCSAYVQYHHFNSYGMDDSEETEKSFYRMIAQVEAAAEQRGAERALRNAARFFSSPVDDRFASWAAVAEYLNDSADRLEGDDD